MIWPCVMDGKIRDVEKLADGAIDVCLFNGSIRTSEQEYMARLLRRKSKVLVAFGSCAQEGCIPGLANLYDRRRDLRDQLPGLPLARQPRTASCRSPRPSCPRARCNCRSSTTR